MRIIVFQTLLAAIFLAGCGMGTKQKEIKAEGFVLSETVATGDTGFYKLSVFRKADIRDNLCQQWTLPKVGEISSPELVDDKNGEPIFPQYDFFKDGQVLENPRHHIRMGNWKLVAKDSLLLSFNDGSRKTFAIAKLDSRKLQLITQSGSLKNLTLNLEGNGMIHKNSLNDPFHPANNTWRIKPSRSEDDDAVKQRVIGCIKFYVLYYRDHLYRNRSVINFRGLPKIFRWYNGGIGLIKTDDIDSSWNNCFHDELQALQGHAMLSNLIEKYQYTWPERKGKVDWWHETHAVLEQMYHKALKM